MKDVAAVENMRFIYNTLNEINMGRKFKKSKLSNQENKIIESIIAAGSKITLENGYYLKPVEHIEPTIH